MGKWGSSMTNMGSNISELKTIKIRHNPVFWISLLCMITGITLMVVPNFL